MLTVEEAVSLLYVPVKYSAFTDKAERNSHFSAPGWKRTTHRQTPQVFSYASQLSLHKTNKMNSPAGTRQATAAFNFISERTI
jgi:hypothetical protein